MDNTIKDHRGRLGLTQAQLAERVDVSRQTIIAIERGRFDPTLRLAFALSDALGVDIVDLFTPTLERNSS